MHRRERRLHGPVYALRHIETCKWSATDDGLVQNSHQLTLESCFQRLYLVSTHPGNTMFLAN